MNIVQVWKTDEKSYLSMVQKEYIDEKVHRDSQRV